VFPKAGQLGTWLVSNKRAIRVPVINSNLVVSVLARDLPLWHAQNRDRRHKYNTGIRFRQNNSPCSQQTTHRALGPPLNKLPSSNCRLDTTCIANQFRRSRRGNNYACTPCRTIAFRNDISLCATPPTTGARCLLGAASSTGDQAQSRMLSGSRQLPRKQTRHLKAREAASWTHMHALTVPAR